MMLLCNGLKIHYLSKNREVGENQMQTFSDEFCNVKFFLTFVYVNFLLLAFRIASVDLIAFLLLGCFEF